MPRKPQDSPKAPAVHSLALLGLDVGQAEATACLLLGDGQEVCPRWQLSNDLPGAEALALRLSTLLPKHQVSRLLIGLEATGFYWWHLACFLKSTPLLGSLEREVYALNPQLVSGFKKAYPNRGKSDHQDAFFIAERLRLGRLPAPFQVDLVYAPLQRLTRFRVHLAQTLAREKNYFLSLLFLKFSTFSQRAPFEDPFGATSSALLEEFTTEELATKPLEELAAFLHSHGRGRLAEPEQMALILKNAARDCYRLDKELQEPLALILGTTLANIRTFRQQLAQLDKTIAGQLAALPPDRRTLRSVPGLGPVWTAGLVAEIGDIHRFDNEAALAKYAGLVWKVDQSGQFHGEDTPLSKAGNCYLRYYLVEGANSVRLDCPEYREYYNAKVAQSTKHAHRRALVLTARKLVRLVDHLLRAAALYRPPESRQDLKEDRILPHAARPKAPRRSALVPAAL